MRHFKVHIVVFFLAVFALGTVASSAMAHCGHAGFSAGNEMVMDSQDQSVKADAAQCGAHDHGQASTVDSQTDNQNNHKADSVDCEDCSGIPCQSQIQIPQGALPSICIEADALHLQSNLQFNNIFLTIIPHPPNQLS